MIVPARIRTIAPPAVEPLTLDEVKAFARVESGNAEDALLAQLIEAARRLCENWTRRSLITQTHVMAFDEGVGRAQSIDLWRAPVQEIVEVRTLATDGTPTVVSAGSYYLTEDRVVASGTFPTGRAVGGLEVEYRAGYGDTGAYVPAALKQGMLMVTAAWYEQRESTMVNGSASLAPTSYVAAWQGYRDMRL